VKINQPLPTLVLFLLLAATCSISASADIQIDVTIAVPGLEEPIEKVTFGDIDGHDSPELLVTDGESVLLYQPSTDETLFHHNLDSLADSFEIEGTYGRNLVGLELVLADVNRDSLVDVIIAVGLPGDYLLTGGGYGILCYNDIAAANPPLAWEAQTTPHDGLGVLKAIDLNGDGYNELVFSSDTAVFRDDSLGQGEIGHGQTLFYHSFPDSIYAELPHRITDFSDHGLPACDILYPATTSHTTWERLYGGPNINHYVSELALVNDKGVLSAGVSGIRQTMCTGDHHCLYTDELKFECSGDINTELDDPSILTSTLWRQFCMDFGCCGPVPNFDSAGYDLCLYRAVRHDSLEEIWCVDISGSDYENFFFHPLFPGRFFALWGNELLLFDGTDGSFIDYFETLPEGRKYLDRPFADAEDCLVVLDANRVSILSFDVATDVPSIGDHGLPSSFTLNEPYPNPFNATASVSVSMTTSGHLTVEVYNSLGQRVDQLFDATAGVGEVRLTWDASRFASGVYLIRATADENVHTVKALLLK
jgi:hypothetical protein